MTAKTQFLRKDFVEIISNYNLGKLISSNPVTKGTVQTNFLLKTTEGKFIFRYYENRSKDSVLFESCLIEYLRERNYPCPSQFKNESGNFVDTYNQKPFIIFEFIEGHHIKDPNNKQRNQLIEKAAELHLLTKNYKPFNKEYRLNYDVETCLSLAQKAANNVNTKESEAKLKWLQKEVLELNLPKSLPKGICHCDFHFSNVLFKDSKFVALLDFDDANYTYLLFDLVGLIESGAWHHDRETVLNFEAAKKVVSEYMKYRSLNVIERRHLFDVYKLSIFFDCIWYFDRGNAGNFYEKQKIEFLNSIGASSFYEKIFK